MLNLDAPLNMEEPELVEYMTIGGVILIILIFLFG